MIIFVLCPVFASGTTNSNMTQFSRVWSDLVVLLRDEIYVINVLGMFARSAGANF